MWEADADDDEYEDTEVFNRVAVNTAYMMGLGVGFLYGIVASIITWAVNR